jgi:hypothetical protein
MKQVSRVRAKGSFAQLKSIVMPSLVETGSGSGSMKGSRKWFSSGDDGSRSHSDKDLSTVAPSPAQHEESPSSPPLLHRPLEVKQFEEGNEKEDEGEALGLQILPMEELRDQPETTSPIAHSNTQHSVLRQRDPEDDLRILEIGKEDDLV